MKQFKLMGDAYPRGTRHLVITAKLGEKLGLSAGEEVQLQAGLGFAMKVKVTVGDRGDEEKAWLTKDLFTKLKLLPGLPLVVKFDCYQRIMEIGPVLGLFTTASPDGLKDKDPVRLLMELIRFGRGMSMLTYVFTVNGINWSKRTVKGYVYNFDTEVWTAREFPLPNVVYDRIHSRRVETSKEVQTTKRRLWTLPTLKYFNPRFLDKWECHKLLWNVPEVKPYIPETQRYMSIDGLMSFLTRYSIVYLKPCKGSLGRGIMRIVRLGQNSFQCKYRVGGTGNVVRIVKGRQGLSKIVRQIVGKKPYILQQGLRLQTLHKAPFDIRILMQKDHKGQWRRTKMLARVAQKGSITSNISSGADAALMRDVLRDVFHEDPKKPGGLGNRLRNMAEVVALALEQQTGVDWGELGIDVGVDIRGNIWLIEINSKPFKAMETEKGSIEVIHNSVNRPLGYAKYLWKQAPIYHASEVSEESPNNKQV